MFRAIFVSLTLAGIAGAEPHPEVATKQKFLENGKVRIGVDLSSGGSIFWFSELPANRNMLNHFDRGRFIQQSYYGKPDGSLWVDKPWRWNPVQGGDYKGRAAKLLEVKETESKLYVRSIPVNWAGGEDIEECRMEQWITLDGEMAHIRFRFSYKGDETHPPTHQELPAVFVDYALPDLVFYKGDKPWTDGPVHKENPGWPNEYRDTPEHWAAFVGADGRGVGVLFPGTNRITTYRYKGSEGPMGSGCSYFSPIRTMAVTPGMVFEYDTYLMIGTVGEMRARFKPIALRHLAEAAKPAEK